MQVTKRFILPIWWLVGLVVLAGFSYIQFVEYIIPGLRNILNLDIRTTTLQHSGLVWVPIVAFSLIGCNACVALRIFTPKRDWDDYALIWSLKWAFLGGLFIGICWSVFSMLAGGLVFGLVGGLAFGFLLGLSIGLFFAFLIGLYDMCI